MQEHVREQVPEPAVEESGAGAGPCTATGGQEEHAQDQVQLREAAWTSFPAQFQPGPAWLRAV